jgi:hypothetical protein
MRLRYWFTVGFGFVASCDFALASERLIPMGDALDLSVGNINVIVSPPERWQKRRNVGYGVGFGLTAEGFPVLDISAFHLGRHHPPDVAPQHSDTFVNWVETATEHSQTRQIDLFDAGSFGKATVWRIRSTADDFLLVIIIRGDTRIEVYLRSHDADDLYPYLEDLKQTVRSIQLVTSKA